MKKLTVLLLLALTFQGICSARLKGPLSWADALMNSTVIARSGGIAELRAKTDRLYTPLFELPSFQTAGQGLQLDRGRLEFFSYALNSRLYEDAAALLFTDGLFRDCDTLRYLKGLLCYDIHNFPGAAEHFRSVPSGSPFYTNAKAFTDIWTSSPKIPGYKEKSPLLAGAMSALLPGSGKIYAGDLRSGISTMLIVGALGAIAAESWAKLGSGDWRTITLTSIFGLFYTANIYGSAVSVSVIRQTYEDAQKATLMFDLRIPLHQF